MPLVLWFRPPSVVVLEAGDEGKEHGIHFLRLPVLCAVSNKLRRIHCKRCTGNVIGASGAWM